MVNEKWNDCLANEIVLPIEKLKLFDRDGEFNSFKYFTLFSEENNEENPSIAEEDIIPYPQFHLPPDECEQEPQLYTGLTLVNESEYAIDEDTEDDKEMNVSDEVQENSLPVNTLNTVITDIPSCKLPKGAPCTSVEPENNEHELQTTLAKNCSKVVGICTEVLALDKCRSQLRLNNSKSNKESYLSSMAKVQTKVLSVHGKLKHSFHAWEVTQVTEKGREPWTEDLMKNHEMHDIYKTIKLAEQLLKHWKITVHL